MLGGTSNRCASKEVVVLIVLVAVVLARCAEKLAEHEVHEGLQS